MKITDVIPGHEYAGWLGRVPARPYREAGRAERLEVLEVGVESTKRVYPEGSFSGHTVTFKGVRVRFLDLPSDYEAERIIEARSIWRPWPEHQAEIAEARKAREQHQREDAAEERKFKQLSRRLGKATGVTPEIRDRRGYAREAALDLDQLETLVYRAEKAQRDLGLAEDEALS